ncbi:hypothetical protein [Streptomyces bacillaris]|uniref:hypothetical protein n=1 Tax=Streptomyces bacillaris TaxID=68179 RepID=UPI003644F4E8
MTYSRALAPHRLEEIQALAQQLTTAAPGEDPQQLLRTCRTALTDLLADREDLVRAHAEAAEELAQWTGAL